MMKREREHFKTKNTKVKLKRSFLYLFYFIKLNIKHDDYSWFVLKKSIQNDTQRFNLFVV